MPTVSVSIGGRSFAVACQDGEEEYLRTAAAYIDAEAQVLGDQAGSLTESRLLLMSGLMLADRTAGLEEQLRQAESRLVEAEAAMEDLKSRPPRTVEVPVVPEAVVQVLADLTAEAEALADQIEERTS